MRNAIVNRITRKTPISIERELSLFHPDCTPLRRRETSRFLNSLRPKLQQESPRFDAVAEVAGNSFEFQIGFSTPETIVRDMELVHRIVINESKKAGLLMIGISPPSAPLDFLEFFTTRAFPEIKSLLAPTNSIHIHVGGTSEEELIRRYTLGNMFVPNILDISQSSVVNGIKRGRAYHIVQFMNTIPEILAQPWIIRSFAEYYEKLENAREAAQQRIITHANGSIGPLCAEFPKFAQLDAGRIKLLQLTPDKVFHLARLRPDLVCEEMGLMGSVEFRAIDGQATLERDLAMIELVIGMQGFLESKMDKTALSTSEVEVIMQTMQHIAYTPISESGRITFILRAMDGFEEMGLDITRLQGLTANASENYYDNYRIKDVVRSKYIAEHMMSDENIISTAAEQYMGA